MSQIAFVIANPDYTVADSPNFLSAGVEVARIVRGQLPISDNVTLSQVAITTGSIVVATAPVTVPPTPSGTNGILSTVLTWGAYVPDVGVKAPIALKIQFIANAGGAVLETYWVDPTDTGGETFVATAVAQKAKITAVNSAGSVSSVLSATFTPTAS